MQQHHQNDQQHQRHDEPRSVGGVGDVASGRADTRRLEVELGLGLDVGIGPPAPSELTLDSLRFGMPGTVPSEQLWLEAIRVTREAAALASMQVRRQRIAFCTATSSC